MLWNLRISFCAGFTFWRGHLDRILYYFNFVPTPFLPRLKRPCASARFKNFARALWVFRWGAMITFLAGILMYSEGGQQGTEIFLPAVGVAISWRLDRSIMFLNVWLVIWPISNVMLRPTRSRAAGSRLPQQPVRLAWSAHLTNNPVFRSQCILYVRTSHYPSLMTHRPPKLFLVLCLIISARSRPMRGGTQGRPRNRWTRVSELYGRLYLTEFPIFTGFCWANRFAKKRHEIGNLGFQVRKWGILVGRLGL